MVPICVCTHYSGEMRSRSNDFPRFTALLGVTVETSRMPPSYPLSCVCVIKNHTSVTD